MELEDNILHEPIDGLPSRHRSEHEGYEYTRRDFVRRGQARQCVVNVYEIPPGKSAYPYHYHLQDEEVFYIVSGQGTLRTTEGERPVRAGELLLFPAGEGGAHKLTNTGAEPLLYIDFDTANDLDAALYPDSGKMGVWGKGANKVFRLSEEAGYYEGE